VRRGSVAAKVRAVISLINIESILMVICQALSNEFFAGVRDRGLWWELHLSCIEDCLVTHYCHLRLVVAERFHTEEKLVEDDAHAPDINLLCYLWILALVEAFGRLVPVGAYSLAR